MISSLATTGATQSPANADRAMADLGRMAWLAARADIYRERSVHSLLEWLSVPVALGQYRIYAAADGRPLAFVTWALLDAEAECRHLALARGAAAEIDPRRDWSSGDRIWFLDLVAPFGHCRQVCADLRRNVFPGRSARTLRIGPEARPARLGAFQNAADPLAGTGPGAA